MVLESIPRVGLDVHFGMFDATPFKSQNAVSGHRHHVKVEQAQDRDVLFSLGYDHKQVEKIAVSFIRLKRQS